MSYINLIKKKKKKSYLDLKRGKECTGGSSDNLMVVRIWPYGVDGP